MRWQASPSRVQPKERELGCPPFQASGVVLRQIVYASFAISTATVCYLGLEIYKISRELLGKRRAVIRCWGFVLPSIPLPPLILIIPLVYLADYKRAKGLVLMNRQKEWTLTYSYGIEDTMRSLINLLSIVLVGGGLGFCAHIWLTTVPIGIKVKVSVLAAVIALCGLSLQWFGVGNDG